MFHVTVIWSRVEIMTHFGHILEKHLRLVPALRLWGFSYFVFKLNLDLASNLVYRYFRLIFNLHVIECSIELVNHVVANSISKLFIEESMTRALLGLAYALPVKAVAVAAVRLSDCPFSFFMVFLAAFRLLTMLRWLDLHYYKFFYFIFIFLAPTSLDQIFFFLVRTIWWFIEF